MFFASRMDRIINSRKIDEETKLRLKRVASTPWAKTLFARPKVVSKANDNFKLAETWDAPDQVTKTKWCNSNGDRSFPMKTMNLSSNQTAKSSINLAMRGLKSAVRMERQGD